MAANDDYFWPQLVSDEFLERIRYVRVCRYIEIYIHICLLHSILTGSGRGGCTYYENVNMELKGPHSHFEEVKLESNPAYEMVSKPTSADEPQYEECGGGVTNHGNVAMEENPAYQSVDTKPKESTY